MSQLADYIVNEIQEVYGLQGVTINDKLLKLLRQMLQRVKSLGRDSDLIGEQLEFNSIKEINAELNLKVKSLLNFNDCCKTLLKKL